MARVGPTGARLSVRELLSDLIPGRLVAIRYEDDLWHERVLLGPGLRDDSGLVTSWLVETPDHDKYEEDMTMEAGEGAQLVVLDDMGNCPPALRGKFYRFAADGYPTSAAIVGEAQAAVRRMRDQGQEPPLSATLHQ